MLTLLEISFYSSYFFLAGTSALTAFEVFSNFPIQHLPLKYILAIETTVNIIASFAYNYLVGLVRTPTPNFTNITIFRYLDWVVTTPLLLISFTLYLQYLKNKPANNQPANNPNINKLDTFENTVKIDYTKLLIIVSLNVIMLIFGFMGETGRFNHFLGCVLGFIPFIAMFYFIWKWYGARGKNDVIFGIFLVVWSLYGVVYFLPSIPKNISYNLLDIIAKVGFGLLIWFEVVNMRLNNKLTQLHKTDPHSNKKINNA
jgi:bacteriorhodopsin